MSKASTYPGVDTDGFAETEADNFINTLAAANGSVCAIWPR